MLAYLGNVGSGLSHLFNALTGGDPMNSFSARIGEEAFRGSAISAQIAVIIDFILCTPGHCIEQAEEEGLI